MILVFDTEEQARAALTIVNASLGCPIHRLNGYKMEKWDSVHKAVNTDKWYFGVPENVDGLEGYVTMEEVPGDWIELSI